MSRLEKALTPRGVLLAVLGAAALQASSAASAMCVWYGTSNFNAPTYPSTVAANGANDGRPFGGWQRVGTVAGQVGCTDTAGFMYVTGSDADVVGTYTIGSSHSYSIYKTGVEGLGVIAELRPTASSGGTDFLPLLANATHTTQWREATTRWPDFELQIRFIKYGDVAMGTVTTVYPQLGTIRVWDGLSSDTGEVPIMPQGAAVTVIRRPVCRPQSRSVYMGTAPATGFTNKYDGWTARSFRVTLDCDVGVGTVDYYLEPAGGSDLLDKDRGIVSVTGGAEGVGLQVMDAGDRAIPFDGRGRLFGTSTTGESLEKEFRARYVQTAADPADIVPGQADATVRILMDYP